MRPFALILTLLLLSAGAPVGWATHEGIASAGVIETGDLGPFRYFNSLELSHLGFTNRDLSTVKYLKELDLDLLASGGPPPDAIPSIDEPRFISIAQTDEWLADEQLVLGIRFNGLTRAYPLAILNWHEIVNDDFDGAKVVVTYCPLCDSGLAFLAPELEGVVAEFGTSGRLFRSDLVMYDRVTATFWEQFQGRPIVGPLVGVAGRLHRIPVDIVPYGLWKLENPDTGVLDRPREGDRLGDKTNAGRANSGDFSRDYFSDPYSRYRVTGTRAGSVTEFGVPFNDDRLGAKDQVVGIVANGQAKAYAREAMIQQRLLNDAVGGVPVLAVVSPAGEVKFFERSAPAVGVLEFSLENDRLVDGQGNAWSFEGLAISGPLTGTQLKPIIATPSFWFAWVSFNPNTELFGGNDEAP